jgi:hypothetical protein
MLNHEGMKNPLYSIRNQVSVSYKNLRQTTVYCNYIRLISMLQKIKENLIT